MLVGLGKTLNLKTLAEGIENEAELTELQEQHCDQGQGFLYARPLDAEGIENFLNANTTGAALVEDRSV